MADDDGVRLFLEAQNAPGDPDPEGDAEVAAIEADAAKKRRSGWTAIAVACAVVVVAGVGVLAYELFINSTEKRYLAAVEEAGLSADFTADRAAVQNAANVCSDLDNGGPAQGTEADRIGVEYYCPDYLQAFKILRTTDVSGTFSIISASGISNISGTMCEGDGGFGDLNASTPVIVRNAGGDELARTELGRGRSEGSVTCEFGFTFPVSEGEEQYILSVGDRGESSYTFEELLEPGAVALTIG